MPADVFEARMLICFGVAWPASIVKLVRTKSSAGKSILFELDGERSLVILLYIANAPMVATDLALTLKYRHNVPLPGAPRVETATPE